MLKKTGCIMLCILLALSVVIAGGCNGETVPATGTPEDVVTVDKPLMLFLGDSIAEAILGPSPIIERENYGYYALIGRRSEGYMYRNRSVSGHQTAGMVEYIVESEGENAMLTKTYIREADVICVSIIGNDVLQNQFDEMFIEHLEGRHDILDRRLSAARVNIDKVIKYIRELNPDVTLILQTVYNPIYTNTPLLRDELRQKLLAYDVNSANCRSVGDGLIERMNDVLRDYLKDNPGAYYLMDVNTKFDEIFDADEARGSRLIYPDGTHPSGYGHAVIADMYQEYLESIGKTTKDYAVAEYKKIRCEQLDRMYAGELDVAAIKAAINAATSCEEITELYFDAIVDATPDYSNVTSPYYVPESEKIYFSEDKFYKIDSLSVVNYPIAPFLDSETSYMRFNKDGTFEIELNILPTMISVLNNLLLGNVDLSTVDLEYWSELYAEPLFPGFDIDDAFGTLGELGSVCVYLKGFDTSDPTIAGYNEYISENLGVPEDFRIPEDFGIEIKGKYSVHRIRSAYSGDHIGVYLGDYVEDGDPLFILTEETDKDGRDTMLMQFFVLNLQMLGVAQ